MFLLLQMFFLSIIWTVSNVGISLSFLFQYQLYNFKLPVFPIHFLNDNGHQEKRIFFNEDTDIEKTPQVLTYSRSIQNSTKINLAMDYWPVCSKVNAAYS